MRLICPGCAAQYEVSDTAIPPDGRDVQCSSCGHTWFQRGPLPDGTLPQDRDDDILAAVSNLTKDKHTPETAPPSSSVQQVSSTAAPSMPEADAPDPQDEGVRHPEAETTAPAAAAPAPAPRQLDDSVLAILREEAEREARARRADAGLIETQPDLGLALQPQAIARRPPDRIAQISDPVAGLDVNELREKRMASPDKQLVQEESFGPVDEDELSENRRNRLPDIEEINSTLRGASERAGRMALPPEPDASAENGKKGFRIGFLVVVALGVLALLAYAFAGQIGGAVPALAPLMESYVGALNALRLWTAVQADAAMRALLNWIS